MIYVKTPCGDDLHNLVYFRVTGSFDGSLRVWNTSNWETSTILGSAHIGIVDLFVLMFPSAKTKLWDLIHTPIING